MKAKQKFTYEDESKVYLIKLKKRKYWWLLLFLLLLLPLLLLIRFEKDIVFKTVNKADKTILIGTKVDFSYVDRSFIHFKQKKAFYNDTISYSDTTNSEGIVVFKDVSYTLFARLFYSRDYAEVEATNNCFMSDSLMPHFFSLKDKKETILELAESTHTIDFQVIDKDDKQPIPNAKVVIIDGNGNKQEATTDANGTVVFENIAYCSKIEVIGSKNAYKNDTISDLVARLLPVNNERILELEPLKEMITFIVKNLKTKEVIPNAKAKLILENDVVEVTTNTNGVGKGAFKDIRITEKMHIEVSKEFYYDTTTASYAVEKYIKLSEKERTIYLRPQTKSLIFINTDGQNPLVGVTNKITVNGKLIATEMSNNNGIFTVADVFPDDEISIVASKNGYKTNSQKVNKQKVKNLDTQEKRTIPLTKNPPPPPPPPPPADDDEFEGEGGDLRINLQWKTLDDLDLLVKDPCGNKIWALELTHTCRGGVGTLDIDANTNRYSQNLWTKTPQENAFWDEPAKGNYTISVEHCIKQDRDSPDPVKFNITIIYKNKRHDFSGQIREKQTKVVTVFEVD